MNRSLIVIALALLLAPQLAEAQPEGACLVQTTSKMDALLNPPVGGDEKFFTSAGGVPNVHIILDNTASMVAWPEPLCVADDSDTPATGTIRSGCGCTHLNNLGYSSSTVYETEIKNINSNTFYNDWFATNRVYQVRANYGTNLNSNPSGNIYTGATRGAAITNACVDASNGDECRSCLASRGYYLDKETDKSRMLGNFLNFYSPKYLTMRRVVKQVVRDIRKIRMSMSVFSQPNDDSGLYPDALQDFNPPCSKSNPFTDSSSFDSNRQNFVNTVNGDLGFTSTRSPMARSVWLAGYLFNYNASPTYDATFPGWETLMGASSEKTDFAEKTADNAKSVCYSCAYSAILLLTGSTPQPELLPMFPTQLAAPADCPECLTNSLDEVADWLATNDVRADYGSKQSVDLYTISFSPGSRTLLRQAAGKANTTPMNARNATELRDALLTIFDNIDTKNTSFSAAAVASIQTNAVESNAILPRMSPSASTPWKGEVWRFKLFNEFASGVDKNGDGDKDDVFVVDNTAQQYIVVEQNGRFVRGNSGDAGTEAAEVWEAREKLVADGHASRDIYTIVESSSPNGRFTANDTRLAFTQANWATLLPYMGIAGAPLCPTGLAPEQVGSILRKMKLTPDEALKLIKGSGASFVTPDAPTQEELDEVCARAVIQWVRGQDVGDEDNDDNRTETRDNVLGDIFHSSPVMAGPPVDKFVCDLGLSPQCARTLYATDFGTTSTPMAASTTVSVCGRTVTHDPYDAYHYAQRFRDQIILVGANDGMLHAFHDGDASTETCVGGQPTHGFVNSSGRELWGLIPPDQLPRLHERLFRHTFYVDADVMVRDIWSDDNGDGKKSSNEYHTMAVVPEGRGGVHYFAIELKWDSDGNLQAPDFRWMFPQPSSPYAASFGKTLYALSPKAPPIGPVLLKADTAGTAPGVARHGGVDSTERWVVALSGGWSPGREKGRGVYIVDAYQGTVNGRSDNLWFKFDYDPGATGKDSPRTKLTHSVAAPVGFVDYGASLSPRADGYFDTAVFGDLAGQLWVLRMYAPGEASPGGLVTNWGGGRALEQDKSVSATNSDKRWPFYFLPTIGLQPDNGAMRAFIGSGNRYSVLDPAAGTCQFDNPMACAKYDCTTASTTSYVNRYQEVATDGLAWASGVSSGSRSTGTPTATACGTVTATVSQTISGCPSIISGNTLPSPYVRDLQYTCSGTSCSLRTDAGEFGPLPLDMASSTTTTNLATLGKARYYGVWVYGGTADRTFDENSTSDGPEQYDSRRLNDRGTQLKNVTGISCGANGTCTDAGAGANDFGWFYEYDQLDRKTASGSTLIGGCTLWNNIYPQFRDAGAGDPCDIPAASKSRLHQANYLTGLPNCAASFALPDGGMRRFVEMDSYAPPPEPTLVVSISPDGMMRTGVQMLPPGQSAQNFNVGEAQDPLQLIYSLDVSKAMHNCRHTDGGCTGVVP